jgi:hypothetical protein
METTNGYKDLDTLEITEDNIDEMPELECECGYFGEGTWTFFKPYDFESGEWVCVNCKEEIIK